MDTESLFRVILSSLIVGFVTHRAYYTRRLRASRADGPLQPTRDKASSPADLLSLPALLAMAIYIIRPEWLAWSSLPLPPWLRWIGVGVAILGFGLLQWSQVTLGRNWSDSPQILRGQTLTTHGPYRWLRHPIYAAFLMILGSSLLIAANWLVGLLWFAMTALDVRPRILLEEALMIAQFGDSYREYMRFAGALLPRRLLP